MPDQAQTAKAYIQSLRQHLSTGDATEHTHRPALEALLEGLQTEILATNEPKRIECGAPDFSVARKTPHGSLTLGYLEAKDVGEDLAAIEKESSRAKPATVNGRQLKRYREALPNLVLTDYLEFRWYVNGARRGEPVRLAALDDAGKLKPDIAGLTSVLALLDDFLAQTAGQVNKPKELAERMARLTRLIRDVVVEAFGKGKASSTLNGLHAAFREVLVPDLSVDNFADMFSQTLTYGLFAARVQHHGPGPFQRQSAAVEIPRTNPFLRNLFGTITGPALDDEPFAGLVDDLAQLLAETDMAAVLADFGKRTRQEDPIVHFYETFLAAYDPKLRKTRGVYYTPEPVVSYIVRSVDYLLRTRFNLSGGLADQATATYATQGEKGNTLTHTGPRVLILDPACGTGTFLYAVLDLIRSEFMRQNNAGKWSGFVREQLLPRLFGFELLMAPYAVAHLKLGMQLAGQDLPEAQRGDWAYDFASGERLGVYLTNTLEEALKKSQLLMGQYISEEANAAVEIKKDRPIMVVLGNPPYSGLSANMGEWIVGLLKGQLPSGEKVSSYYEVDGKPLGEKKVWLQDDYVKFIRFGQWRIQQTGQGILAFITNHGYLDNPTFRGMRQQLMNAFTDIYILNLHGNVKKKEDAPDGSKDENVFDIQQGVVIGAFVKERNKDGPATVHHADLWGMREGKYQLLASNDVSTQQWTQLDPTSPFYFFVPREESWRGEYEKGWKITDISPVNSSGIVSARDEYVFDLDEAALLERMRDFRNPTNADDAIRSAYFAGKGVPKYPAGDTRGWKLSEARKRVMADVEWDKHIVPCLYRPFDIRPLYYAPWMVDWPRPQVMRHMLPGENLALVTSRLTKGETFKHAQVTRSIVEVICMSPKTSNNGFVFPLYLYPAVSKKSDDTQTEVPSAPKGKGSQLTMGNFSPWPEGKNGRRPNLRSEFVKDVERRIGLTFVPDERGDLTKTFGPEDVLHYIYGLLHSPKYRRRYAEFLKMDFPRIPLTSDVGLFRELTRKGADLVALHLMESPALGNAITSFPVKGDNLVEPGHPRYVALGEFEPGTGKTVAQGRVYISKDDPKSGKRGQYLEGVPKDVWEFQVGGYQVCDKWLKDRRGRVLTNADITHYEKIVVALRETIRLMAEIDTAIEEHGGWPIGAAAGVGVTDSSPALRSGSE